MKEKLEYIEKISPSCQGDVRGVITNIQSYSIHDGPGIRTLVFLKGCPLRCQWCCNPENLEPGIEIEFYASKCIKCGTCLAVCSRKAINPDLNVKSQHKIDRLLCDQCEECVKACRSGALKHIGRVVTVEEVLEKTQKDKYYYLTSKGGITISGGEPLYQFKFTQELLRCCYLEHIDTAIETCGHAPWNRFRKILPYLNRILFDIKHMDPSKHKKWTGVSNRLTLSNLKRISKYGIPVVVRLPLIPMIPRVNLEEGNLHETGQFISGLANIQEVNILPFHQLGKDKYLRLSRNYALKDMKDLSSHDEGRNEIKAAKNILDTYGLRVTIGG